MTSMNYPPPNRSALQSSPSAWNEFHSERPQNNTAPHTQGIKYYHKKNDHHKHHQYHRHRKSKGRGSSYKSSHSHSHYKSQRHHKNTTNHTNHHHHHNKHHRRHRHRHQHSSGGLNTPNSIANNGRTPSPNHHDDENRTFSFTAYSYKHTPAHPHPPHHHFNDNYLSVNQQRKRSVNLNSHRIPNAILRERELADSDISSCSGHSMSETESRWSPPQNHQNNDNTANCESTDSSSVIIMDSISNHDEEEKENINHDITNEMKQNHEMFPIRNDSFIQDDDDEDEDDDGGSEYSLPLTEETIETGSVYNAHAHAHRHNNENENENKMENEDKGKERECKKCLSYKSELNYLRGICVSNLSQNKLCELENELIRSLQRIRKTMNDKWRNEKLCVVCLSNNKDTIFRPCGHFSTCNTCSDKLGGKCPICQQTISDKFKVFQ